MYPVQFIWGSTIICVTSKSPISQSVELLSRVSNKQAAAPGALVQCQRVWKMNIASVTLATSL